MIVKKCVRMTSTKLTMFCLYLMLYCQCSDSANAPLNTTRQDSNPDTMDVSTDVIVTTVDTRVSSASPAERVVRKYVIGPLAFFGIGGNLLTLLVWSAEAGFNPTTFYIKVLAVSDIVLLGDYLLWHFHPLLIRDTLPLLFYGLEVYSRSFHSVCHASCGDNTMDGCVQADTNENPTDATSGDY